MKVTRIRQGNGKLSKDWYIDYRVLGRRVRLRVGPNKKQAELVLGEIRSRLAKGQLGELLPEVRRVTRRLFRDFAADFEERTKLHYRPSTWARNKSRISILVAFFGDTHLDAIDTDLVEQFRRHRDATGKRQIAIEPAVEQHASVGLDGELLIAVRGDVGLRLEAKIGRVRMGTDDSEAALRGRKRARLECDETALIAHHEEAAPRCEVPHVAFGKRGESGCLEATNDLGHRVVGRWASVDEGEQIRDQVRHRHTIAGPQRLGCVYFSQTTSWRLAVTKARHSGR